MKENGADRAVCIDEFEKMIVSELESSLSLTRTERPEAD